MDQEAQAIIDQLKDAQAATRQLVDDLVRGDYPAGKIQRMSLALDNIGAAMRLIENAKYSKDSYTRTT